VDAQAQVVLAGREGGGEEVDLVVGAHLAGVAVDERDVDAGLAGEPQVAGLVAGQRVVGEVGDLDGGGGRVRRWWPCG
jgi:hypothetical protein